MQLTINCLKSLDSTPINTNSDRVIQHQMKRFMSLPSCIPLDLISEKARIELFTKGLNTNIGSVLLNANPITLQQAINVAQHQGEFKGCDDSK